MSAEEIEVHYLTEEENTNRDYEANYYGVLNADGSVTWDPDQTPKPPKPKIPPIGSPPSPPLGPLHPLGTPKPTIP